MASVVLLSEPGHPVLGRLAVVFDSESRLLERGGRQRHLAPREAGVLAVLLRSEPGEVVCRNDLLDAVWGEGEVCEDALTVIVSRLRRHFQKLGVDEPVIETVPRRGYRLGRCEAPSGGFRDARREDRVGRMVGLIALGVSALALAMSFVAVLIVSS